MAKNKKPSPLALRHMTLDGSEDEKFEQQNKIPPLGDLIIMIIIAPFYLLYLVMAGIAKAIMYLVIAVTQLITFMFFRNVKNAIGFSLGIFVATLVFHSDTEMGRNMRVAYHKVMGDRTLEMLIAAKEDLHNFRVPEELRPLFRIVMDDEDIDLITKLVITEAVGKKGEGAVPVLGGFLLHKNNKIAFAAYHALKLIGTDEADRLIDKHGTTEMREASDFVNDEEEEEVEVETPEEEEGESS